MSSFQIFENIFLQTYDYLMPDYVAVQNVFLLAILAVVILTPLEYLFPAFVPKLRKPSSKVLDVTYWFLTPLVTKAVTGLILCLFFATVATLLGIQISGDDYHGFGPLSLQPLWLQAIEMVLIADFVDYWTHRFVHSPKLWPIHAIHHSPSELSWLSSARVHPFNDLLTRTGQIVPLVALGYSAKAVVILVPFLTFYVMFLHANIRWDFGVFRWVLVSPAYHRWHHSTDEAALDKNYAGILPFWDILFGTVYFPKSLPTKFGLNHDSLSESLASHLYFPFRYRVSERSTETKTD